jgi:Domain of unknown function (DUF3943)
MGRYNFGALEDSVMRKTGILLCSVFLVALSLSAQTDRAADQTAPGDGLSRAVISSFSLVPSDSPPKSAPLSLAAAPAIEPGPRRPAVAVAEAVGVNLLVWLTGYLTGGQQAFISLETINTNFNHWFEWDPNHFRTNFFAHPYHGSLYFNAGRTNGLNYWQSGLCSLGGSFMWETMMERHYPSINDLIMTTTGGMFLGETLFRYAALVRNDNARGFDRVWREAVSLALNPVGTLNRLIFGGDISTPTPSSTSQPPLGGIITLGGQARGESSDLGSGKTGPSADFMLVYGTPFKDGKPRETFDYFPIEFTLRFQDKTYLTIYGYSLLLGKELGVQSGKKTLLGLFQHYDYINTEAIELGGSSLCGGIVSQFDLSKTTKLTLTPQLGWMILGVSNNEYVQEDLRDYNFGTGLTAKLDAVLDFQKYGNLLFRWGHYTIYALEGAKGTDRLNIFTGEYRIPVWKQVMVGLQYQHYRRNSDYRDFPDVKKFLYGFRVQLSYRF